MEEMIPVQDVLIKEEPEIKLEIADNDLSGCWSDQSYKDDDDDDDDDDDNDDDDEYIDEDIDDGDYDEDIDDGDGDDNDDRDMDNTTKIVTEVSMVSSQDLDQDYVILNESDKQKVEKEYQQIKQLNTSKCSGGSTNKSNSSNALSKKKSNKKSNKSLSKVSDNDVDVPLINCPICGRGFKTSGSMSSHVSKAHKTTLGPCFTCHICGAVGRTKATLKRHLQRTHNQSVLEHPELLKKCCHCDEGMSSQMELYNHIRKEHKDLLQLYHHCPSCPALLTTQSSLIRHVGRTHPEVKVSTLGTEICDKCGSSFLNRFNLRKHIKKHHPAELLHKCEECQSTFKYPYMLTKHCKAVHREPKVKPSSNVNCTDCGKQYCSSKRLARHRQEVHINPRPRVYRCSKCDISFTTDALRVGHYKAVHRNTNPLYCSECGITYITMEEFKAHRIMHKKACPVCNKEFVRRGSLREHLLIHNGPRLPCPYCPKCFTQNSNLRRHIRIHTGEKPYKCTLCPKVFSDKSACNSHIRVHTGAERCSCSVCGVTFSKRQKLNYHMRKHTGDGLMYCPLCTKPHTNSYSLRKHVETHQSSLFKALSGMGLEKVLDNEPGFIPRALNALAASVIKSASATSKLENSFNPDCIINEYDNNSTLQFNLKSKNSTESSQRIENNSNCKQEDDDDDDDDDDDVCDKLPIKKLESNGICKQEDDDTCDDLPIKKRGNNTICKQEEDDSSDELPTKRIENVSVCKQEDDDSCNVPPMKRKKMFHDDGNFIEIKSEVTCNDYTESQGSNYFVNLNKDLIGASLQGMLNNENDKSVLDGPLGVLSELLQELIESSVKLSDDEPTILGNDLVEHCLQVIVDDQSSSSRKSPFIPNTIILDNFSSQNSPVESTSSIDYDEEDPLSFSSSSTPLDQETDTENDHRITNSTSSNDVNMNNSE